ncbi:MAG: sigma-70 family RNA polymerase sigma factor [Nannocystaceae bacterium]
MGDRRQLAPREHDGLVALAADGDRGARGELYRVHAETIARHLCALVGDPRLAEDLTHDVFVTAFASLASYDARVPIGAWLHGIAVNHARNHRRRSGRRTRLWQRLRGRGDDHGDGPDAVIAGHELATRLYRALDELDDARREAFVLRVIEQLSLEDAARVLGVPAKTLSKRARAAERHVRARLEAGR